MIVIDTSVVLKWVKQEEPYSDKALELFKKHKNASVIITVPNLIYIEAANALVTRIGYTETEVKEGLRYIFAAELKNYNVSQKTLEKTSTLAKKYKTSVYDMLYAVIAKENKSILITADEKFIEKTGFRFVKHIKDF